MAIRNQPLSPLEQAFIQSQSIPEVQAPDPAPLPPQPVVPPIQQAMQQPAPLPAALTQPNNFPALSVGGGDGILSKVGGYLNRQFGFDQPDFLSRLGNSLAVAGSPDPFRSLMMLREREAENQRLQQAQAQANRPKIVGSAGPNGAIQLVQMPDGSIVPRTLDQVMQMNKDMRSMDFDNDVRKAIAIAQAQDQIRTAADNRKADRDSSGERVQAGLNVQQLNQIADSLEKTDTATGPIIGLLPKWARDIVTPQGAALQDAAERIVQGGLRATLGGQFTQAEGDRFLARAYNPRLSEAQNAQNLRTIAREIAAMQLDKKNALEYFQRNGTLEGFTPNANAQGSGGAAAPAAAPAPASGGVARPTSKADFDRLPRGTRFIAPDGKEYIK